MRLLKLKSVLVIQKWIRGFLVRLMMARKRAVQFKAMRKIRRILSVAYGKKKKQLIH
jgi:hypothetical protein